MKPITIIKKDKETLFDAAKRATAQADINNRNVIFQWGIFSIIVYPNDIINNVLKALSKLALENKIAALEARLSAK